MNGAQFNRALRVAIERDLAPATAGRRFAEMAAADVQKRIAAGEVPPQFARYVDGRIGAGDEAVRGDSVILYRFNVLAEAAKLALAELKRRSPERTGTFKASFYLGITRGSASLVPQAGPALRGARGRFAAGSRALRQVEGGRFIKAEAFNPKTMSADAFEIIIGNTQPYNRRVDSQRDGSVPLKFDVPPWLYAETAAVVRRRFPTVDAQSVYTMLFPQQYRLKTGPRAGRPVHSPAIVISTRE